MKEILQRIASLQLEAFDIPNVEFRVTSRTRRYEAERPEHRTSDVRDISVRVALESPTGLTIQEFSLFFSDDNKKSQLVSLTKYINSLK